jgi:hypothetical protein
MNAVLLRRWWRLALALGCSLVLASGCATPYQGPVSPQFDGTVFSNPGVVKQSSVLGYLWLRLTTPQAEWPSAVPSPAAPAACHA